MDVCCLLLLFYCPCFFSIAAVYMVNKVEYRRFILGRLFVKRLPYTIGPLSVCCVLSVRPVCLWRWCIVVLWPNGWMDQDATWYGGRPRPRPHCVRWGPNPPPSPCILWPNSCPSRLLLSFCELLAEQFDVTLNRTYKAGTPISCYR